MKNKVQAGGEIAGQLSIEEVLAEIESERPADDGEEFPHVGAAGVPATEPGVGDAERAVAVAGVGVDPGRAVAAGRGVIEVRVAGPWFGIEAWQSYVEGPGRGWWALEEWPLHRSVASAEAEIARLMRDDGYEAGTLRVSAPIDEIWFARCRGCGEHANDGDYYYESWQQVVDLLTEDNAEDRKAGEPERWIVGEVGEVWCRDCAA